MKRRTGILIVMAIVLLCVCAAGAESVYDTFGNMFRTEEMIEGFSVPVPADESGFRFRRGDGHYMTCKSADNDAVNQIYIDYYVFDPLKEFAEDRDTAEAVYAAQHYEGNRDYQGKNLSLDGHLAQVCVFRGKSDAGDQSIGILLYVRTASPDLLKIMYTTLTGNLIMTVCLAVYAGAYFWSEKIMDIHM